MFFLGFTGIGSVLWGFMGLFRVLLGLKGALLGFTGFEWD